MDVCSEPDCGKPATLGWQRAATPKEASDAHVKAQSTQQAIAKHRRSTAQLHLVELRHLLDKVKEQAAKGDKDARETLPDITKAVAAAEKHLAELPPPTVINLGTVHKAVFACEDHEIDPEHAGVDTSHKSDCTPASCRCHGK